METYKYYTALIIAMAMSTCMVFAQAPVRRNTTTNRATSTPTRKPTQRQTKPATTYAATGMENGHGYVDLGLSVKWATCNVGASTPGGWGESTPYRITIHKHDIYSGEMIINGGAIR